MKKATKKSVPVKKKVSKSKHKVPIMGQAKEETIGERMFPEGVEPAFVKFSEGFTKHLGGYEYLRLDIAVTMPCLPEKIHSTFAECKEFVETNLTQELEEFGKAR